MIRTFMKTMVRQQVGSRLKPMLSAVSEVSKQKAPGRMFSVQQSLPHLPVPALSQTLNKFLLSVKPLLSDEDYYHAEKLVADFGSPGGEGEKLQALLEKRAQEKVNWLEEWWLNVAYLDYRLPNAIHVSPGLLFPVQDFQDQQGQLKFAAKLISGVLDYKIKIDEQTLPVEKLGGEPLCMMQYYKILSACRIPGPKRDRVVIFPPDEPNPPRHIIVIHNNYFFKVDVYGKKDKPLNTEQIFQQLVKCVNQSQKTGIPVGILTSDGRNAWSKAYDRLRKDKTNRASIEEIQRCIFSVSLDQPVPHASPDQRLSVITNQMNHGGGSHYNSGNRWFDKTLQFIVGSDGAIGLNYEHATAEGPPIISLVDHSLEYVFQSCERRRNKPENGRIAAAGVADPQRLRFNFTPEIEEAIENASVQIDSTISDLNLQGYVFKDFGKNFIKTQKMSPDAFIQVCLQLAYYRLYKEACATYESGSLRRFQMGRTDTIRSCSIASHSFSKGMDDSSVSPVQKVELLRNAVASHRDYSNSVVAGQGIDRHLLGLKLTAVEHGLNVPKFLLDSVYTSSCHWKLSTSQVPSKHHATLCFAPVVPDGYGVCYNPMPENLNFAISSWNSSPETDAPRLANSLFGALRDTQKLLLQTQKAKL